MNKIKWGYVFKAVITALSVIATALGIDAHL